MRCSPVNVKTFAVIPRGPVRGREHSLCAVPPAKQRFLYWEIHQERSGLLESSAVHNLRDFRPDLHAAIECLHGAGFDGEAYVLAASMEGAYSTALEMLSAIGGAVLRVERGLGSDIPKEVQDAFARALDEVRKAVPLN